MTNHTAGRRVARVHVAGAIAAGLLAAGALVAGVLHGHHVASALPAKANQAATQTATPKPASLRLRVLPNIKSPLCGWVQLTLRIGAKCVCPDLRRRR